MSKDDYIRFRCSTELKELAGRQAEEKGMNITDYMEYLIRKDRGNMMYLFDCLEIEDAIEEKIVNNGLAVVFNENRLLAKVNELVIDGQVIKSDVDLEEYIQYYDGGEFVELTQGLQIGKDDAIDVLLGELYQPCNDEGLTYAERIYNAKSPRDEIEKLIEEFLLIAIEFRMTEIQSKIVNIKSQIENGKIEWK